MPSHYPCDLAASGVSEQLPGLQNIGWANAVPDSEASVDIRIGDYHIKFAGYGYHDKVFSTCHNVCSALLGIIRLTVILHRTRGPALSQVLYTVGTGDTHT